jgi:hypothetical protein
MTNLFTLTIGDIYYDGHNQTETFILESNLSLLEVENTYKKFRDKSGIAFEDGNGGIDKYSLLFNEYEDRSISDDAFDKLINYGVGLDFIYDTNYLGTDEFIKLFINCLKVTNPELELKVFNMPNFADIDPTINAMGYGLFD